MAQQGDEVSMALTKAEMKEASPGVPTIAGAKNKDKGPKYPWGLELRLDERSMEKLGMTDLPEVGELCQITGIGRVVAVSQRESADNSSKDVTIQIERLSLAVQEEEEGAADADEAFAAGAKRSMGRGA